jgi:hypothetical protein
MQSGEVGFGCCILNVVLCILQEMSRIFVGAVQMPLLMKELRRRRKIEKLFDAGLYWRCRVFMCLRLARIVRLSLRGNKNGLLDSLM